ncbi:MAG TPA: tannase/feruloyl esterase family alpha/beta hydrolase [Candidatus Angelobacter sp.]|nr:tannase/feruloyl esterase family alpha/beta hydrolase [Candidatus Angelobacter sp.]
MVERAGGANTMRKIMAAIVVMGFLASVAWGQKAQGTAGACENLGQLALPKAKVVSAETVAAGAFTAPANMAPWLAGDPSFYKTLPEFCRVVAQAAPSADSDIKIEVWMPAEGWNGNFRGQGNGGFAGEIDYHGMGLAVQQKYATAATNTGHSAGGTDASWALGHPEKVADFGYRAIHEMTQIAKTVMNAYFKSQPQHSYFASCSNGGRQALMEAQRFPADFDGILAGAPANYWTHLLTKALADALATTLDPASYIPASKLPAIAGAVNAACDAQDGVADGVLNDPQQCKFDAATLLCKAGDSNECLTAPQITALKKLYAGPRDAKGNLIFPGYLPGAEEGPGGWGAWITGTAPGKSLLFAFGGGFFTNFVYEKADWNYKDAKIDEAMKAADEKDAKILNATDANLTAFKARGGKLILYHGWNDAAISALNTVYYYNRVTSTMGATETTAFSRLYMVPGLQHCGGGPGANAFGQGGAGAPDPQHNMELALEQWVEKGVAPAAIVATKFVDDNPAKGVKFTRPLCPYPQTAKYKGTGDTNDAANFVCAPGDK